MFQVQSIDGMFGAILILGVFYMASPLVPPPVRNLYFVFTGFLVGSAVRSQKTIEVRLCLQNEL